MNYSPIGDPEFEKFREAERKLSSKKRRKKTLVLLFTCAIIGILSFSLLALAAFEAFPALFGKETTDAPKITEAPDEPTPQKPPVPVDPSKEDPTLPKPTPTPTPTPTVPPTPSGSIHTTTVYIDPGHGFNKSKTGMLMDYGAGGPGVAYYDLSLQQTGTGLYESDINMYIAVKMKKILEDQGYKVIMSREGYRSEYLSARDRHLDVNKSDCDVCISIHANSFKNGGPHGARIMYYSGHPKARDCKALASAVASAIDRNGASTATTTIHDDSLVMTRDIHVPCILAETCFLTNVEDAKLALTEEWQNKMAKGLAEGIMKQFPLLHTHV